VSNEDGTNLTTLYKSPAPIRIDLAPRGQHQIAITDDKTLKLLTFDVNGSGAFVTTRGTHSIRTLRGSTTSTSRRTAERSPLQQTMAKI